MKALTIHQPCASLIAWGLKRFETRSWAPSRRQLAPGDLLAIHASKRLADFGTLSAKTRRTVDRAITEATAGNTEAEFPHGAVVCVCRLVVVWQVIGDCMVWHNAGMVPQPGHEARMELPVGNELLLGDFSPGRYAWELEVVEVFPEPIPARGQQGLWEWERGAE